MLVKGDCSAVVACVINAFGVPDSNLDTCWKVDRNLTRLVLEDFGDFAFPGVLLIEFVD